MFMLEMIVGIIGIIFVGSITFDFFPKLKRRTKSVSRKVSEVIADKLGDARDDRNEIIKERELTNKELEEQLVQIKTNITLSSSKQQNAVHDAEKYGKIAKMALEKGDESAARTAIIQKQRNEELSVKLLESIKTLEDKFLQLKDLLNNSKNAVEDAKLKSEIYKTDFVSLKLEKQMLDAEQAFGGLGNLNLNDSEQELERMRAEINARKELSGNLDKFQNTDNRVEEELAKMKASV